jgi:hypothetical protein
MFMRKVTTTFGGFGFKMKYQIAINGRGDEQT